MLQHFPLPHFQRPTLGLRTECSMRSDRQRKQPGYSLEAPIPMSRSGEKATYHERVRVCRNDIQSTKSKDHQAASFKSCLLERRSVRPHDMRRMRMNMTRRSTAVNQCDDITFRHGGVHAVVRTSVFGRRTFPDLLWVNQAGQLSLPSLRGR